MVSDEEGKITFIDTAPERRTELPLSEQNKRAAFHRSRDLVRHEMLCHQNAIFDVAWIPGEDLFATSSGDTRSALWDINRMHPIRMFEGHTCSVKSINVLHANPSENFGHIFSYFDQ